jgi:uncharacterized protein with predicted RNA binding PUA domain
MADRGADVAGLRTVADYQFGRGAGPAIVPTDEPLDVERSKTGRPRQLRIDEGRLASYNTDGRLSLGVAGGRRLQATLDPPECRVTVGEESEPFVLDGKNAFAKFVTAVDDSIRPGDEVLVVREDDRLLGVGRAELSAAAMRAFETGMAVMVREGAGDV